MTHVTYSVELLEATINKQVERIEALEQELRNIDFATLNQCARIEQLEAALREIATLSMCEEVGSALRVNQIASAALAPEQARVDVDRESKAIRLATIEECAMVAINAIGYEDKSPLASFVANAIRALSPAPPSPAIVRIEALEAALKRIAGGELASVIKQQAARIEQLEAEVRRYASEAVMANTKVEQLEAAAEERLTKLHDLLETIREQIRLGVAPEHRPEGLFKNIQDAVYIMRGRTVGGDNR